MEIYPIAKKKWSIPRIRVKDIVTAVFLMALRAGEAGCGVVFFPEAGALPLKYIFEHRIISKKECRAKIFSSKVTASTKSSLDKQICAILTPEERHRGLTERQIFDFKKILANLPKASRNKLIRVININHLDQFNLSELIGKISEIGLYVPSEDRLNWIRAGIIPRMYNPDNYSPEDNSFEEFQKFRKKIITYSLDHISEITHDARPLLNIILSKTNFAKALDKNTIYVIDEAISRGRTLNALEIIFKSFNKNAIWKIGVLFCPFEALGRGNIDFILSSNCIPPFSNRFDLIGEVVVETDTAFVRYNINRLFLKRKKIITEFDNRQISEYFRGIRQYVRRTFTDFLSPGIIDEDDLIRLFHFIFVCHDMNILKKCINLNPMKVSGLIEEVSFYINMPHPFDPIPIRKVYKNSMLRALEYLDKMAPNGSVKKDLQNFKKSFYSIRKNYELLELQCWSQRYYSIRSEVDSLIELRKL